MRCRKVNFFLMLTILLLIACNKNDITRNVTIRGNIRNNCTGLGFENMEVLFRALENKVTAQGFSKITDSNGNFEFHGVNINNDSKYTYDLYVEPSLNSYGVSGNVQIIIDKNNLSTFHQFGLSAKYRTLNFYLPPGTFINSPDSLKISVEQPTYHFYEPFKIWQVAIDTLTTIDNNTILKLDNYPMGLWYIKIAKTKAGLNSIINDSIYMDMGATSNYTIPW